MIPNLDLHFEFKGNLARGADQPGVIGRTHPSFNQLKWNSVIWIEVIFRFKSLMKLNRMLIEVALVQMIQGVGVGQLEASCFEFGKQDKSKFKLKLA